MVQLPVVVRVAPAVAVLGIALGCVHVHVHRLRAEEVEHLEARVRRPRWPVEAFDHAAHGDRSRHFGRLPIGLRGELSMAMPDLLRLHADGAPDRAAVIVDAAGGARPSATTYAELNALVNRLAHALLALGMQRGDRLVWCGPNSLEVIVDAPRRPGRPGWSRCRCRTGSTRDEMQYVIDNSDATLVVVDAEQAPLVASVRDRLPEGARTVVVFGGDVPAGLRGVGRRARATSPKTSPCSPPRATRRARRADDLHVGHHREAQGRAAHHDRSASSCSRCSPSSGSASATRCTSPPARCTTRARSRSRSLAHTLGATDRRAAQVRPERVAAARRRSTGSPTRSPRPTQLKRIVSLPAGRARRAPTCRRCAA